MRKVLAFNYITFFRDLFYNSKLKALVSYIDKYATW